MTRTATATATLDTVWDARDACSGRFDRTIATSDGGNGYRVLGTVPGDPESVFAQSIRTDLIVMVTRTGTVNVRGRGAQVRARITPAVDTGDAAGTLSFDPADGFGAVCPRGVFGWATV